jgi:hypothetical protein
MEQNKWLEYEQKKQEIFRTAESHEEYERRIAELVRKLNL